MLACRVDAARMHPLCPTVLSRVAPVSADPLAQRSLAHNSLQENALANDVAEAATHSAVAAAAPPAYVPPLYHSIGVGMTLVGRIDQSIAQKLLDQKALMCFECQEQDIIDVWVTPSRSPDSPTAPPMQPRLQVQVKS